MPPIDVFIPYHPKDRRALPHVVASLFRHLSPAPTRVICVGSGLPAHAAKAVRAAGGELLDEREISEIPHRSLMPEIVVKRRIRTGWYYQQLLKWGFRRLATTPAYAVIDADSVLVAPLILQREQTYILDRTDQRHEPYFDHLERLLGWRAPLAPSFIINYQIIDVVLVNALISEIEMRRAATGQPQPWHVCIMDAVDRSQMSGYSEFETYGHWLARHHPLRFESRPGSNYESNIKHLWLRWFINARARKRDFTSVSYHEFNAERLSRFRWFRRGAGTSSPAR